MRAAVVLGRVVRAPASRGAWSPPPTWSRRCGSSSSSTRRPSATPPREPGRFTTTVRPATPARARLSAAVGVAARPAVRIASATPGSSWSSTARVASGVRSPGFTPVPPVVMSTDGDPATAPRMASATSASATTTGASTSKPRSWSQSTMTGPVVSSAEPAAAAGGDDEHGGRARVVGRIHGVGRGIRSPDAPLAAALLDEPDAAELRRAGRRPSPCRAA